MLKRSLCQQEPFLNANEHLLAESYYQMVHQSTALYILAVELSVRYGHSNALSHRISTWTLKLFNPRNQSIYPGSTALEACDKQVGQVRGQVRGQAALRHSTTHTQYG